MRRGTTRTSRAEQMVSVEARKRLRWDEASYPTSVCSQQFERMYRFISKPIALFAIIYEPHKKNSRVMLP